MSKYEFGLGESVKLQGRAAKWIKEQKKKNDRIEELRIELIADINKIRNSGVIPKPIKCQA